jgi:hypothetical protein
MFILQVLDTKAAGFVGAPKCLFLTLILNNKGSVSQQKH